MAARETAESDPALASVVMVNGVSISMVRTPGVNSDDRVRRTQRFRDGNPA